MTTAALHWSSLLYSRLDQTTQTRRHRRRRLGSQSARGRQLGFTLVELLVSISITALLIGLLLPALGRARDYARLGVCLSNMRQIGVAHTSYYNDNKDSAPFVKLGNGGVAAFSYGGKTTSKYWQRPYYLTYRDRQLNRYLYPTRTKGPLANAGDEKRIPFPLYKCPSDIISYQRRRAEPLAGLSSYDDVGTSYMFNMIYFSKQMGPGTIDSKVRASIRLVRRMTETDGSRFIIYLEDAASMGLWTASILNGDHGRPGWHSLIMADGHGVNEEIDTTKLFGNRWTAIDDRRAITR